DPFEWKPNEPGGPAVDPVTGLIVAGTRDGFIRAVTSQGKLVWEYKTNGPFDGGPLIHQDGVFIGCDDGRVYSLELMTGKLRWSYDTQEEVGTRPVLANGTIYVFTLEDTLFALDAATGAWKWHHRREGTGTFAIRGRAG